MVSWQHSGWQKRDCRLPAPGLCWHVKVPPFPCPPPPETLPRAQIPPPGAEDTWKLSRPPFVISLQKIRWPPQWVHQRFVLRDLPAQWHQWL